MNKKMTLRERWNNFLTSGMDELNINPFTQKAFIVRFMNIMSLFMTCTTLAIIFVRDIRPINSDFTPSAFDFVLLAIIVGNIFFLRRTRNISLVTSVFMLLIVFGSQIYFLYYTPQVTGSIFYIFVLPLLIFIFKGSRAGLLWLIALFIVIGVLLYLKPNSYLADTFSLVQFVMSVATVAGLMFAYQRVNEQYAKIAEANQDALINAVENLEQEKLKVETTLQSVADGIVAVDTKGAITSMNTVAETLSGYTFVSTYTKHYNDIFKFQKEDDPTSPYLLLIDEAIREGKMKSLISNLVIVRKDGTKLPVAVSATPIRDVKGNVIGCVAGIRDTTEEQALMKSKVVFVSVAAHKLRTPLGIIRGTVEGILTGVSGPVTPQLKESALVLQQVSYRMLELVNELLVVLQIDQRQITNNLEPTNILDAVYESIMQMAERAQKKAIALSVLDQTKDLPSIMLDRTHFQEVMVKLLGNAIDYNQDKGTVTVKLEQQNNYLLIHIVDTGIGIPEKDFNKVFTKFYRSEQAFLKHTEGSGLGLFIAKAYIESIGGKITFRSLLFKKTGADGKEIRYGTEFIIILPIKRQATV